MSGGDVIVADGNPKRVKAPGAIHLPLTAVEVDEAAKAVGLRSVRSKLLDAHARIGKYVEQQGAVAISRGMFLMSAEQAQDAAEAAGNLVNEAPDMESKLALLKAQQGFMKLFQDAAKGLHEASQVVTIQKAGPPPPPPPGVLVSAQNVTLTPMQSTKP